MIRHEIGKIVLIKIKIYQLVKNRQVLYCTGETTKSFL